MGSDRYAWGQTVMQGCHVIQITWTVRGQLNSLIGSSWDDWRHSRRWCLSRDIIWSGSTRELEPREREPWKTANYIERFATLLEDDWIRQLSLGMICLTLRTLCHTSWKLCHTFWMRGHEFSKGYVLYSFSINISWIILVKFRSLPVDFRFDRPEPEVRILTGSGGGANYNFL